MKWDEMREKMFLKPPFNPLELNQTKIEVTQPKKNNNQRVIQIKTVFQIAQKKVIQVALLHSVKVTAVNKKQTKKLKNPICKVLMPTKFSD